MSKYIMPKKRKDFENMLVNVFMLGMNCGYGVEHTELSYDENVYRNRFRALIQGKINCMDEIIDNERTYNERIVYENEKMEMKL